MKKNDMKVYIKIIFRAIIIGIMLGTLWVLLDHAGDPLGQWCLSRHGIDGYVVPLHYVFLRAFMIRYAGTALVVIIALKKSAKKTIGVFSSYSSLIYNP